MSKLFVTFPVMFERPT